MSFTIELDPDMEAGLLARAHAEGLDVSGYMQNLVRSQIAAKAAVVAGLSDPDKLSPEKWVREFKA